MNSLSTLSLLRRRPLVLCDCLCKVLANDKCRLMNEIHKSQVLRNNGVTGLFSSVYLIYSQLQSIRTEPGQIGRSSVRCSHAR